MDAVYVDMHCHLDLYREPKAKIEEIARHRAYVLSVTTTPAAWPQTAYLARGVKRVQTALGLHPQLARERLGELALFDRLLPEARYVGEVGLDGSPDCKAFWSEQQQAFTHILASCARLGGRVLTVHSRAAAGPVLDALERQRGCGTAILHWFSGTARQLDRAVELGCWFSVGPAMLRSAKGRALTARMPMDRVLTETDGPFGLVKRRALEPAECSDAVSVLADLWQLPYAAAKCQVFESFRTLTRAAGV